MRARVSLLSLTTDQRKNTQFKRCDYAHSRCYQRREERNQPGCLIITKDSSKFVEKRFLIYKGDCIEANQKGNMEHGPGWMFKERKKQMKRRTCGCSRRGQMERRTWTGVDVLE